MKKFLICSCEESIVDCPPILTTAETEDEAIIKFLRSVYSRDLIFRESVLDLSVNMTFVERFYFENITERTIFDKKKKIIADIKSVKKRIERFFSAEPSFGEIFLDYMETKDPILISDDIFEFIAISETKERHGHIAIDIDMLNYI